MLKKLWELTRNLDAHPVWLSFESTLFNPNLKGLNLTISKETPKEPTQIRLKWGALKTIFPMTNETMLELFNFHSTLYYILSK